MFYLFPQLQAWGWLLPCVILIFILRADGMPSRQQLLRDKSGKMCVHVETPGPLPPEAFLRLIALGRRLSTLGRLDVAAYFGGSDFEGTNGNHVNKRNANA